MRLLAFTALTLLVLSGCLNSVIGGQPDPYDYVTDEDYTQLVIEVDYVQGFKPSNAWLDHALDQLRGVLSKDSIRFQISDAVPGKDTWSDGDIRALRDQYQDMETGGDTVVLWLAYLDGEYTSRNVLGITYGHEMMAIFTERITTGCSLNSLCLGQENTIQRAVLVHEFGHAIGLVDRGIPMVNAHSDGGKHSSNRNSVMYASVESTGIFGFGSNIPTTFDSNDKLDLCSAGGRGSC